ncbi:MAG TPA: histidine kinase [Chitinophagaceae bacterium]|nr:histidine kinase [Chitinophagaceae bacterium]
MQTIILTIPYVSYMPDTRRFLFENFLVNLVFLVPHMFLVYSLMYFVIPRYFTKSQNKIALFWSISLLLFATFICALFSLTIVTYIRTYFLGGQATTNSADSEITIRRILGVSFWGINSCITISGFALTIKLLKLWYTKEQKNIQLQKENLVSKTQLLQSQIHPHFLFNTLNNIYSSALVTAPKASQMIMRLSSLLRYILYECNKPQVLLKKELDMIKEYIALETMRYDEKLEINVELAEQVDGYSIAPLLLLPFVENCFKHGTSNIIEKPWINLHIQLKDGKLIVKLVNGKALNSRYNRNGIGISNVKTRLELLYSEKHELTVIDEDEVFGISLMIALDKRNLS